ncbi:hypothetical protein RhiJN_23975 [Ceratobasidium sp. AG-Ba]|nr:hypothetical protein RhiJN_23975 [Ceratobasidium sp. AG-Ba]
MPDRVAPPADSIRHSWRLRVTPHPELPTNHRYPRADWLTTLAPPLLTVPSLEQAETVVIDLHDELVAVPAITHSIRKIPTLIQSAHYQIRRGSRGVTGAHEATSTTCAHPLIASSNGQSEARGAVLGGPQGQSQALVSTSHAIITKSSPYEEFKETGIIFVAKFNVSSSSFSPTYADPSSSEPYMTPSPLSSTMDNPCSGSFSTRWIIPSSLISLESGDPVVSTNQHIADEFTFKNTIGGNGNISPSGTGTFTDDDKDTER